jgi:hypothetical protein
MIMKRQKETGYFSVAAALGRLLVFRDFQK